MNKLVISLIFALISVTSAANAMEIHQHMSKDIGDDTPVPKIEIQIFKDPMDGVNVHVEVENYQINAPDMVATDGDFNAEGVLQGHAHVFVNAEKLRRLYGKDIHIPAAALKEGVNQVAVSLNSHRHENWVKGNHDIMSSIFFDLSKDPIVLHNFTSQPLENKHKHH
ncbi:MAG: hypothetical protein ABJV04_20115 [Aliiglaciecola sp.]|uniref:hypothetical protein n=1 Tax=Aliiglaciecola sp. TaxID=1872441 RepID=UPI00329A5FBE